MEICVAAAIAFERVPGGVELEAVDLDDEALSAPEEVDLVSIHENIELRHRKLGGPDEREEAFLGLGSREHRMIGCRDQPTQPRDAAPAAEALGLRQERRRVQEIPGKRFVNSAFELAIRGLFGEIDQRARRARNREAAEVTNVSSFGERRAMDA